MKTELTTEQSKHLIGLGAPDEKASLCGYRKNPIFKLADLLEILPKKIDGKNRIIESDVKGHFAYYCGAIEIIGWRHAEEELIDALYQLACWYYGEYLKK